MPVILLIQLNLISYLIICKVYLLISLTHGLKKHFKRRVVQPELVSVLSNCMQKGSLIFIKTDVKELFDHMDFTIKSMSNFQKINEEKINFSKSFNPNRIRTLREKYVIDKKLEIFERIYTKT